MRKEPAHRYQSASEFADDIKNYLQGFPLIAGPESVTYKIKKFVTKNKWSVAAVLAIFVTLTGGLIVSSALYFRAEHARSNEENQKIIAQTERDRAAKAERQAQKALANSYEEQGRKYMDSGDLDKALLVLNEAYRIDSSRQSTKFLLSTCMSRHKNPAIHGGREVIPWPDKYAAMDDVPFSISPDRKRIALVDKYNGYVEIFDTATGELQNQFRCESVAQLVFTPTHKDIIIKMGGGKSHHILKVFDLEANKEAFSTRRNNVDIDELYEAVDADLPNRKQMEKLFSTVCMSPDGDWFAFIDLTNLQGGLSQSMKLWDFEARKLHTVGDEHLGFLVKAMGLRSSSAYGSPQRLMTLNVNNVATPWKIPNLERFESFPWKANSALIGPRGITVINLRSHQAVLMNRSSNYNVRSFLNAIDVGYSPDETRIVVVQHNIASNPNDSSKVANLWQILDGVFIGRLVGPEIRNWHFTSNSKYLVTEHDGGQVRAWWTADCGLLLATDPGANLTVTDIGPDSTLLLLRDTRDMHSARMWNIRTGDLFELYQNCQWNNDLGSEFTSVSMDRTFAFSRTPASYLPRFNAGATHLITESGLRPIGTEIGSPEQTTVILYANIPLRLDAGRFRPTSTTEMLSANCAYNLLVNGEDHEKTVNAGLDVIEHEIETLELDESAKLGKKLRSWMPFEQHELNVCSQEIINKLSHAYSVRADRYERQCRYAKAIEDYEMALKFCSDDPNIYNELAWLMATCPDGQLRDGCEAVKNSRRACELTDWNDWQFLSTYAVSCAATDRFAVAVTFQTKAIDLTPASAREKWQANFEKRLELYRARSPYERKKLLHLPERNLIGWWKFDEYTGTTILDSSGNGHHAEFHGTPRRRVGQRGWALQFDSTDDFVSVQHFPAFDTKEAMTVVCWFQKDKPGKITSDRLIVGRIHSLGVYLDGRTGELTFECHGLDVPSVYPGFALTATGCVDDARRHHVAAIYDGASMSIYIDGAINASTSASGSIRTNRSGLRLGKDQAFEGREWFGMIDDLRIYNRALTAAEIARLYDDTK